MGRAGARLPWAGPDPVSPGSPGEESLFRELPSACSPPLACSASPASHKTHSSPPEAAMSE